MKTEKQKSDLSPSEEERKEYEKLEEEFRDAESLLRTLFQKSMEEYYDSRPLSVKPPDLSFMEEDCADGPPAAEEEQAVMREFCEKDAGEAKKETTRRPFRRLRSLRAAAVLLVAFVLAGGMYYAMDSQLAYAARFHLEKVMYQISGKYYTSDEDLEKRSNTISICIESMEEIPQAVRFMPELYVPSYLPEGWELENIILTKSLKGKKTATYSFMNNLSDEKGKFQIIEIIVEDTENINSFFESDILELEHRTVSVLKDEYTGLMCCNYLEDNISVTLSGSLEQEEMLLVADSMEQPGMQSRLQP